MQPYCNHEMVSISKVAIEMSTITKRVTSTGEIRYRALLQIRREDVNYTESRTFSKKSLAEAWLKKREVELETNPELLHQNKKSQIKSNLTLAEAMEKYLEEVASFGRSKRMGLRFLCNWPIGKIKLKDLKRQDYSAHTLLRKKGVPEIDALPIKASTALQDLQYIKSVLKYAEQTWGEKVDISELDKAMAGLRDARIITKSVKRSRLATSEELQILTNYFYKKWKQRRTAIPVHLILWFAIYSCRREAEISRLKLSDYDKKHKEWLVRDLKNPNGRKGNDKFFVIDENTQILIDELMKPDVRERMLKLGGDIDLLIPINHKSFATRWQQGLKMLGIEDLRFHDLRHEGATRLAENGLTIPQLQQHTLHESWSSLERYVQIRRRNSRLDFKEAIQNAELAMSSLK